MITKQYNTSSSAVESRPPTYSYPDDSLKREEPYIAKINDYLIRMLDESRYLSNRVNELSGSPCKEECATISSAQNIADGVVEKCQCALEYLYQIRQNLHKFVGE